MSADTSASDDLNTLFERPRRDRFDHADRVNDDRPTTTDTIVDDLEDLFSTPRARDDKDLSTDGIESLFERAPDESLELQDTESLFQTNVDTPDLLTVPDVAPAEPVDTAAPVVPIVGGSVADMLAALVRDLHRLADDIHKMMD